MDHPTLNRTIPHGDMPECVACGECFSNWDRILEDLETKTQDTVGRARRVKVIFMIANQFSMEKKIAYPVYIPITGYHYVF